MAHELPVIQGRGTRSNPMNRFETLDVVRDEDSHLEEEEKISPKTVYLKDTSRTIIAHNDSPDVGFSQSINQYRGCEHGCVYCFARPSHEYAGMSAGLDFETKILVKTNAPQLLREELGARKYVPETMQMCGVTDCYQPVERKLGLTRECLKVFLECRHPVGIVTKNHLVTRDIDLLAELATFNCIRVYMSVTSLDPHLTQIMEPRTSSPRRRLEAIEKLSKAGIPVGVMVAPVVPAINDSEIPAILKACAEAGARGAGYVTLRLPWAVSVLFEKWLEDHFPDRKEKVLSRVKSLRGGKMYDAKFGTRMTGQGEFAEQFKQMFELWKRKYGLDKPREAMTTAHFRPPRTAQMGLFDSF